jgi:hypothetical protein
LALVQLEVDDLPGVALPPGQFLLKLAQEVSDAGIPESNETLEFLSWRVMTKGLKKVVTALLSLWRSSVVKFSTA